MFMFAISKFPSIANPTHVIKIIKRRKTKLTIYVSEGKPSAKGLNFLAEMEKKDLEKREGAKRSSNFYKSCVSFYKSK